MGEAGRGAEGMRQAVRGVEKEEEGDRTQGERQGRVESEKGRERGRGKERNCLTQAVQSRVSWPRGNK